MPDNTESALRCTALGELSMALDPYPFAESPAVFPLPARLMPDQRYASIDAFRETFDRTPITTLECRAARI
jgi:hypothetical protein